MPERLTTPTLPGRKTSPAIPASLRPQGDDARAIGTDEHARGALREGSLHLDHVEHGDALGDADDQWHARSVGFKDRIRGAGRRNEDDAHVRTGLPHRLVDGRPDWHPVLLLAASSRMDGRHHLRAIGDRAAHVIGALRADPLHKQAGVLVDEDSRRAASVGRCRFPSSEGLGGPTGKHTGEPC